MDNATLKIAVEVAVWLAGAAALVGAVAGNRAAWPLLASLAFRQVACWQGWTFDEHLWAMVDLCALLGIGVVLAWRVIGSGKRMTNREAVIVLLFAPLLVSYGLDGWTRYYSSNAVMVAQLLLTFPARRARAWIARHPPPRRSRDVWDDLGLKAAG